MNAIFRIFGSVSKLGYLPLKSKLSFIQINYKIESLIQEKMV